MNLENVMEMTLLNDFMNYYDLEIVIFYQDNLLKGLIFNKDADNNIKVLCKKDNIKYWFKGYYAILNKLKDNNCLFIYLNPINEKYKAIIVNNKKIEIFEANGNTLKSCLDILNRNVGLNILKEINKVKRLKK